MFLTETEQSLLAATNNRLFFVDLELRQRARKRNQLCKRGIKS